MFQFPKNILELLEARYNKAPLKDRFKKELPFNIKLVRLIIVTFIGNRLSDLNPDLYDFYKDRNRLGVSKANIYKYISGELTPTQEFIDLFCYYLFEHSYLIAVRNKELPDQIEAYSNLRSDIEYPDENSQNEEYTVDERIQPYIEEIQKLRPAIHKKKVDALYKEALSKFEKEKDYYTLAKLNLACMPMHIASGSYESARKVLENCLVKFEDIENEDDQKEALQLLFNVCYLLKDYSACDVYLSQLLQVSPSNYWITFGCPEILMGKIQLAQYRFEAAFFLWVKASQIAEKMLVSSEPAIVAIGNRILGDVDYHIGLAHKIKGFEGEVEVRMARAADFYIKAKATQSHLLAQYEYARNCVYTGRYETVGFKELLREIMVEFRDTNNFEYLAKCHQLLSEIALKQGRVDEAYAFAEEAYTEAIKTCNPSEILVVLNHFVTVLSTRDSDIESAFEQLKQNLTHAKNFNMYEEGLTIQMRLALMEVEPFKSDHLRDAKAEMSKLLVLANNEVARCYILEKLASMEAHLGNYQQAILMYEGVQRTYNEIKFDYATARARFEVVKIYLELDDFDNVVKHCHEILESIRGTDFFEVEVWTNFYVASAIVQFGKIDSYGDAQKHLKAAYDKGAKYKVANLVEIGMLLQTVKDFTEQSIHPTVSFEHIVNRLYDGLQRSPEHTDAIIRYWFWSNAQNLNRWFFNQLGLRMQLYCDDLQKAEEISIHLRWLCSLFLVVTSRDFDEHGIDVFPFPYEEFKLETDLRVSVTDTRVNYISEISTENVAIEHVKKHSKNTDAAFYDIVIAKKGEHKGKLRVVGWRYALPRIMYDFIKKNTAQQILSQNLFVSASHRFDDDPSKNLSQCFQRGYIPFYVDRPIESEKVRVKLEIRTNIPYTVRINPSKVVPLLKAFSKLLNLSKNEVFTTLSEVKYLIEELGIGEDSKVPIVVAIVEFDYLSRKVLYPVLRLESYPSS